VLGIGLPLSSGSRAAKKMAPCSDGFSDPALDSRMNLDFRPKVNASLYLLGDPLGESDEYRQRRDGGSWQFVKYQEIWKKTVKHITELGSKSRIDLARMRVILLM
jgi:hypothetical protein